MAGDWIKRAKGLSRKPKVLQIAAFLGLTRHEVASMLMDVWEWTDEVIADPDSQGDGRLLLGEAELSLLIRDITGVERFAEAMKRAEWLAFDDDHAVFPGWGRHNGNSAKKRLIEREKKAQQRKTSRGKGDDRPAPVPRRKGQKRGPEGEVEGEVDLSLSQGPVPVGRSPLEGMGEIPWSQVATRAAAVARLVPPQTDDDRRAWFRYAVLSLSTFSEAWLISAATKAASKKGPQAYFVKALTGAAADKGIETQDLLEIAKRIEIPDEVWASDVASVREH